MYKCMNCHRIFETPAKDIITHWEVDTRQDEIINVCPACGSDFLESVHLCGWCEEEYINDRYDFCTFCYSRVSQAVQDFADSEGKPYKEAKELFGSWSEV